MLRPVLLTPPNGDVVALSDVKAHLNVSHDEDDARITALIAAAISHLDGRHGVLGRCMLLQTWGLPLRGFRPVIRIPSPDVQSVALKYYDADNSEQALAGTAYELGEDALSAFIVFKSDFLAPTVYDRLDAVTVEYVAGYGTASDVPAAIVQAILLLVGHWYENREAVNVGNIVTTMPMGVAELLAPYRWRLM